MTPALFKAFHHRGRIVERTASELQRMGWSAKDIWRASLDKLLACEVLYGVKVYRLVSEPDHAPNPRPKIKRVIPRTEAEYAEAMRNLCRSEKHMARLPETYHKGAS